MSGEPLKGAADEGAGKIAMLIAEIKTGGATQALGMDQMDWGEKGGKLWELWKCEPCCGQPCNPKDGVMCCVHFYCCGLCTISRLLATTNDQKWAIWPHCCALYCCQICTHSCLRYNLRNAAGVPGNICGDCVCLYCCMICAFTQELRSIPKSMWEWIPDHMDPPEVSIPDLVFVK